MNVYSPRTEAIYNGKHCLVTGGAGFIGSHLVDALLARKAHVTILDDLTTGRIINLPAQSRRFKFLKGDVRNLPLVRKLVRKADIVFHTAARVVAASVEDPEADMEVNIRGTLNVLMAARENRNLERLVYTSSASVYGNPRIIPCREEDPLSPLSPYAVSKLSGENYCRVFFDHYNVPAVCLRYFNIYGERQSDRSAYGGVVSIFVKKLLSGSALEVYGDGTQTRDFTSIRDAINATMLAAVSERGVGQVFNVGTGNETSINELAKLVIRVGNAEANIVHVVKRSIDNVRRRVADIEKARYLLRFEPFVPLEEGIETMFKSIRNATAD